MTRKLLIAEDEPNIVESLRFIFERADYQVDVVTSGNLVLQIAMDVQPDAIILDLMLPEKSGYEILKELRTSDSLQHIKVLMLTAKGQEQDRQTALQLGVDAFITKPFSNKEVVACIDQLIDQPDDHN